MTILSNMIPEEKDPDIPDKAKFEKIWEEEIDRTKQMFESNYYNMQIAKSARVFKRTAIIKDNNEKENMEITSVIMMRHLNTRYNDKDPVEIHYTIQEKTTDYMVNKSRFDENDKQNMDDR